MSCHSHSRQSFIIFWHASLWKKWQEWRGKDGNLANLEFLRQRSPELTGILSLAITGLFPPHFHLYSLSLSSFRPSCALSLIWELTVKWMPGGFILPPPLLYHRQRKNYSTARVALLVHLLSVCTESVSVLLSGVSDCWLVPHMLADRKAGVWDGPRARPRNSSDYILNQSLQSCFSLSHRPPTSTSLSFPNPSPAFFSSSGFIPSLLHLHSSLLWKRVLITTIYTFTLHLAHFLKGSWSLCANYRQLKYKEWKIAFIKIIKLILNW